jgi:glycosidase
MDIVPNHTSDEHEWFIKSINREDPFTGYYIWKDSLGLDANGSQTPPNNWVFFILCIAKNANRIYFKIKYINFNNE